MASGDFGKKLEEIFSHNATGALISLGLRLNLFEALTTTPSTPLEIADRAGCKERYVREWASAITCAGVLQVTDDEKFWIADDVAETLRNHPLGPHLKMLQIVQAPSQKLVEVFKKDGPCGLSYDEFGPFYDVMADVSEKTHAQHIFTDLIPLLGSSMEDRLQQGNMKVLDVGCGKGFHAALLAEHYPKTQFIGLDISGSAIADAEQKKKSDGTEFTNLEFVCASAACMKQISTDSIDLVFIFDACHDQNRPDLALKEIHRVLKPGGLFAMIEVNGSSNVKEDAQTIPSATAFYTFSLFHCLPVGNNAKDSLGLGAMWGKKRAIKLLTESGFNDVQTIPTPFFSFNILYLCRK